MILCGERAIPVPHADPCEALRQSNHAGFLGTLHEDLLMDMLLSARTTPHYGHYDALFADVLRAEFARRHAPA